MPATAKKAIKCIVWDLDGTLWDGILLEDEEVNLKEGVKEVIEVLDQRGILQSVASRNEPDAALQKLASFGLAEYFLYPQINWNSKADSIKEIANKLNIGLDTFAFVDDQPYERDEVSYSLPEVETIDAVSIPRIPEMKRFIPKFITGDSAIRRQMYRNEISRNLDESNYQGPKEEFLQSLQMNLSVFNAAEEDLQRAEELTVRTNQLNATGYTYSYDELKAFSESPDHLLLMARLEDKYGTYGHIGLALIEMKKQLWTLKLLLMSCRVMSRGVGGVLLRLIMQKAADQGVILRAEFVPTQRNRLMNITYRLAGFYEREQRDKLIILQHDLKDLADQPSYLALADKVTLPR